MALHPITLLPVDGETVYKRRARRAFARRGFTEPTKLTSKKRRLEILADTPDMSDFKRPRTRADCKSVLRPCRWVSCCYHLALDVSPITGAIYHNHPDQEPGELLNSCALDAAEHDGLTLEVVGQLMNLTRERVRQIQGIAFAKLAKLANVGELVELAGVAASSRDRVGDAWPPPPKDNEQGAYLSLNETRDATTRVCGPTDYDEPRNVRSSGDSSSSSPAE